MLDLQRKDPHWRPFIEKLDKMWDDQLTPTDRGCNRQQDHNVIGTKGLNQGSPTNDRFNDRVVLPTSLHRQALLKYHNHHSHPSIMRTAATLRLTYYWYNMEKDIEECIRKCPYCQRYKPLNRVADTLVQAYGAPAQPFDSIHMDLTGQTRYKSRNGNEYIMVVKCALARWAECIAFPNKSEITVARTLFDRIICKYGVPVRVTSDQGTEFVNQTMKQLGILMGMHHIRTALGNPRSNGLVENHNCVLKLMLPQYVNAFQSNWDEYLQFQCNTTVHSQTGFTFLHDIRKSSHAAL